MDIFRLTYFSTYPEETNKWETDYRYEIYGSAEAIVDIYVNLQRLNKVPNIGPCPNFIEIFSKEGTNVTEEFEKHGLNGLYGNTCNTFK